MRPGVGLAFGPSREQKKWVSGFSVRERDKQEERHHILPTTSRTGFDYVRKP